jgi:hypothetical protein
MNNNSTTGQIRNFNFVSFTVLLKFAIAVTCLFVLLFPSRAMAQFININLEIHPKAGLSDDFSTDFVMTRDKNNSLSGTGYLTIGGSENMYVIATLSSSDSLRNQNGDAVFFNSNFSYRNDGINELPGIDEGKHTFFPLSNSGRTIEYMKDNPVMLYAYFFIRVNCGLPQQINTVYRGDLYFSVEYN